MNQNTVALEKTEEMIRKVLQEMLGQNNKQTKQQDQANQKRIWARIEEVNDNFTNEIKLLNKKIEDTAQKSPEEAANPGGEPSAAPKDLDRLRSHIDRLALEVQ